MKRKKVNCGRARRSPQASRNSKKRSSEIELPVSLPVEPSRPNVELVVKHFRRHDCTGEGKRLYLRVGDEVTHLRYDEWGLGVVMEIMTSSVPGGTCLARIRFQDGQLRCFNNDLDNQTCCYYFGVRRYWNSAHGVNALRSKFFAIKG